MIDQGFAYLALLLNNKAEFILGYNEVMHKNLRRKDVDWSQSKVIFISPQFTAYQRKSVEFKDLAFELWEVNKYSNDTILFNRLKSTETSESITTVSKKSKVVQQVNKEVKIITEEDHLRNCNEAIIELYEKIKTRTLDLDSNIELKPLTVTLAFILNQNIIDITLQKNQIKIWLNMVSGELNDPKDLARNVSKIGHWGVGDYEINLTPKDDLDYLMTLIRQSYDLNS